MRYVVEVRWIRVIGFASIYFFIDVASMVFVTIQSLAGSPDLTWYLEHPWATILTVFAELARSPLLMLTFLILVLQSFILGFLTDWVLRVLRGKRKPQRDDMPSSHGRG